MPRDLTALSDTSLMQLFAEYTAWQNYAAMQVAESEVAETRAEANVRFLEAQETVKHGFDTKVRVAQMKAQAAVDPAIEKARDDVLTCYAKRKLVQVIHANCERCVFVVSRELSRRIGAPGGERGRRWLP